MDGGASKNNFLMQFQADVIGATVQRAQVMETTALGAAYLAGLYAGVWTSAEEIASSWGVDREYTPSMEQEEKEKLTRKWHKAVKMCLGWDKE